jgi:hypothetical protein
MPTIKELVTEMHKRLNLTKASAAKIAWYETLLQDSLTHRQCLVGDVEIYFVLRNRTGGYLGSYATVKDADEARKQMKFKTFIIQKHTITECVNELIADTQ